jgi:type II secretory pathway pseudopilin PulG
MTAFRLRIARDDRGDTLVELLITLVILGISVVALVGGIGAAIRMSDVHRKEAVAGDDVRAFAEAIQTSIAASPSGYIACADGTAYGATYPVPNPSVYTTDVKVAYWNGTAFVTGCTPLNDSGVQQLSLKVSTKDGRASETLVIVIRKPCRSTDAQCT